MGETQYFEYGDREIQWLKSRDSALGAAIDEIGPVRRPVISDLFTALLHSVTGLQIFSKAHTTVWNRVLERFTPMTPETIDAASAEAVQNCGITMKKAVYIKEIAVFVLNGRLDLERLQTLTDDEVCAILCRIKGIGVWTAEMLMTFSMQRMDIMSRNDLAIIRGLRMLYRHREITPNLFTRHKRRYSPYGTVASLYLWAISSGACPRFADPAPTTKNAKNTRLEKKPLS
jgi:DNA-3-methyladenine glycosylase II